MGQYPDICLYDDLIATFGESPAGEKAAVCYKEWVRRGYNKRNLGWVDWYMAGIPNGRGQVPRPAAGAQGAWTQEEVARFKAQKGAKND